MEESIKLEFLDHVGIRVKDMEQSIKWYQEVLGLKKYQLEKWGEAPIFLLSGKCGIALFPAGQKETLGLQKIDHFAFNVNRENYEKAKKKYVAQGLEFEEKDHFYFDSIYTRDPDGIVVELTSIKVDEDGFYG